MSFNEQDKPTGQATNDGSVNRTPKKRTQIAFYARSAQESQPPRIGLGRMTTGHHARYATTQTTAEIHQDISHSNAVKQPTQSSAPCAVTVNVRPQRIFSVDNASFSTQPLATLDQSQQETEQNVHQDISLGLNTTDQNQVLNETWELEQEQHIAQWVKEHQVPPRSTREFKVVREEIDGQYREVIIIPED